MRAELRMRIPFEAEASASTYPWSRYRRGSGCWTRTSEPLINSQPEPNLAALSGAPYENLEAVSPVETR